MSGPVERADGRSIDIALIALARDQVWPSNDKPALPPPAPPPSPATAELEPAKADWRSLIQRLLASSGGYSLWSVFAGLALVPLVILAVFWISLRGPDDAGRLSAAKASTELAAAKSSSQAQTTGQSALAGSAPPQDLARSVAGLTLQIAEARQAVDRLTAGETRMLQENAELARRLKETEEAVRRNAGLVDELKAAQAQSAQDRARLEAQLRASDEQLTKIAAQLSASRDQVSTMEAQLKTSQEQIGHLQDQKQRPKRVSSAAPATTNPPPKPAATPPQQQAKPSAPKPPANSRAKGAQASASPAAAHVAGSR